MAGKGISVPAVTYIETIIKGFDDALFRNNKEINPRTTRGRFPSMVRDHGWVGAVERVILMDPVDGGSDWFMKQLEVGAVQEWSYEALVVKYNSYFSKEVVERANARLAHFLNS
ncbi:hypothetical protein [Chromobacterium sp.]|uniref:hypothetical protein n=1 Tax=Chromobacterium sp. TaxID=306190 RepID=UPI0035ADD49B